MKYFKSLTVITFVLLSIILKAQYYDTNRNIGFFGVTQITTSLNGRAKIEVPIIENGYEVSVHSEYEGSSIGFQFNAIGGYFLIPKYFSLGVGFGIGANIEPDFNSLPIFIDARVYLSDYDRSPYIGINYGKFIKSSPNFHHGEYFKLFAGFKSFVSDKFLLIGDIGFNVKAISLSDQPFSISKNTIFVDGFSITVGLIF